MTFPAVIGVTGLPCAGKSYAARLLAGGDVPGLPAGRLLLADDIGHEILVRPAVVEAIRERFGPETFASPDPAAVRSAIAARVFANPADLAWLERRVHPLVDEEVRWVATELAGRMPLVVEAALLFAAGTDARCNVVFVIEAEFGTRLRRAAARGWDRAELERREERQIPLFTAAWGDERAKKMLAVSNDAEDGLLSERLAQALQKWGAGQRSD